MTIAMLRRSRKRCSGRPCTLWRSKRRSRDLLALHRVCSRLVGQRTGVINQIRGFLIERGITVRQGAVPLRKALSSWKSILYRATGPSSGTFLPSQPRRAMSVIGGRPADIC